MLMVSGKTSVPKLNSGQRARDGIPTTPPLPARGGGELACQSSQRLHPPRAVLSSTLLSKAENSERAKQVNGRKQSYDHSSRSSFG